VGRRTAAAAGTCAHGLERRRALAFAERVPIDVRRPRIDYEAAVEEALAFGWVDSKSAALDDERTMLWFTRRKANSPWSLTNKERIARLEASGRIADAGRGAVRAAKANGMWTILDDAQNLVVPDDLAVELDAVAGARAHWEGFSASARRSVLEWIVLARKPATRQKRIAETVRKAALGEVANQ
jgi:uncharacterized protein YdeI (YjbR/CyaY-like superfamily)